MPTPYEPRVCCTDYPNLLRYWMAGRSLGRRAIPHLQSWALARPAPGRSRMTYRCHQGVPVTHPSSSTSRAVLTTCHMSCLTDESGLGGTMSLTRVRRADACDIYCIRLSCLANDVGDRVIVTRPTLSSTRTVRRHTRHANSSWFGYASRSRTTNTRL